MQTIMKLYITKWIILYIILHILNNPNDDINITTKTKIAPTEKFVLIHTEIEYLRNVYKIG